MNGPPEPRARARTRAERAAQQTAGAEAGPPHPGTMRALPSTLQVDRQAHQQRGAAVARPAPRADAPANETFSARARSNARAQNASLAPMQEIRHFATHM